MDKILLVRPGKDLEYQAIEYKQEHFAHGESVINGSEMWDKMDDYIKWLEYVSGNTDKDTVKPGGVVIDTFFAIRESDRKIVGIIDFRHELNDFFKDFGHCGYSVRPTERRRGYATEMLRQVLEMARQLGVKKVQLSCEKNNIPSVKTIIKNGGIYQRSFQYGGGEADVFIITL